MSLDGYFKAAGKVELKKQEDFLLVARANRLDNFTLWASRHVEGGIVEAVITDMDKHCEWFNAFCAVPGYKGMEDVEGSYGRVLGKRWNGAFHPDAHPFIQAIVKECWEEANAIR